MSRSKRLIVPLIAAAGAVSIAGSLTFLGGEGLARQNNPQRQTAQVLRGGAAMNTQSPTAKELDDAATPIVDFAAAAAAGEVVIAERAGGRVRYADGKIVRYGVLGQGSPMKGKKYLFFLARAGQGNFKLLTAYEVQGEKVFALDGAKATRRGQGRWEFDKHNDEAYQDFREQVGRAIRSRRADAQTRGVGP